MDNINDNIFQVSVKGLFFNEDNKLMMLLQDNGMWEPPGGRIQKGENFIESLKRECFEDTGLECEILDNRPLIVYPTVDQDGRARIMVYFKIAPKNFNFKPSDECVDIKFYTKEEIRKLKTVPQLKPLPDFL